MVTPEMVAVELHSDDSDTQLLDLDEGTTVVGQKLIDERDGGANWDRTRTRSERARS
jgi:hypothetical protein